MFHCTIYIQKSYAFTVNDIEVARAIRNGELKRLYLAGHNVQRGYAVALEYTDADPVRFYTDLPYARSVVERFNRRFGISRTRITPLTNETTTNFMSENAELTDVSRALRDGEGADIWYDADEYANDFGNAYGDEDLGTTIEETKWAMNVAADVVDAYGGAVASIRRGLETLANFPELDHPLLQAMKRNFEAQVTAAESLKSKHGIVLEAPTPTAPPQPEPGRRLRP